MIGTEVVVQYAGQEDSAWTDEMGDVILLRVLYLYSGTAVQCILQQNQAQRTDRKQSTSTSLDVILLSINHSYSIQVRVSLVRNSCVAVQ